MKSKKNIFMGVIVGLSLVSCAGAGWIYWIIHTWPEFGGSPTAAQKVRMESSKAFHEDHFENSPPHYESSLWVNLEDRMHAGNRIPPAAFPKQISSFETRLDGLHAIWMGHATVLIEISGYRVLTDPVFSQVIFPISLLSPMRINQPPVALKDLPQIDAVTISHDHYDHMDMKTLQFLSQKGTHFFVGLGLAAHLLRWNIPQDQIHEMDWWESQPFQDLIIHCTPARHYSGRTSMDSSTLWASWVIESPTYKVFHSGDTGYSSHFSQIGKKLGHIDLSLVKIGDYGKDIAWKDIHMIPEHSIDAHVDLGASVMIPIHWGTFILSNHSWNEPIQRAQAAADKKNIHMIVPMLGQRFTWNESFPKNPWWEKL
ncbi:MAG: MBL fold metallo-hydrolase [Bdellovibrionota bacterium]